MIPTTNRIISILRYARTNGLGAFTSVATGVRVYINAVKEDVMEGFDASGAFKAYRMMTGGNHETIVIGDNITDDQGKLYNVTGKAVSSDLTGTHHQYLMVEKYD